MKTDPFFIIRFCLFSIFAGLKFLARCDVLLSQRRFEFYSAHVVCEARPD